MPVPHCRIGRVTLKAGGQVDLHLIQGGGPMPRADLLVSFAKQTAVLEPAMDGFVVLAWDATGHYRLSYDANPNSIITRTLMPSWVAEVIRRRVITGEEVREIITNEYVVSPRRT